MKRKIKNNRNCATPGCNETVGAQSITGLCGRCYSSIYNWGKRSYADVIKRAKALVLYESRLGFLLTKSKVKIIRPKPSLRPLAVLPGKVAEYKKRTKYKIVSSEKIRSISKNKKTG